MKIISQIRLFSDLQTRLIVSHCAGVGEPLTIERARMMFALRINILAKGYSGISEDTLRKIIAAFNSRRKIYFCIYEFKCILFRIMHSRNPISRHSRCIW